MSRTTGRGYGVTATIEIQPAAACAVAGALRGTADAVGSAGGGAARGPLPAPLERAVESVLSGDRQLRDAFARTLETVAVDVADLRDRAVDADR